MKWEEYKGEFETISKRETWQRTNVECPNCGEYLQYQVGIFLTSNPPQRRFRCTECGFRGNK